jgi:hypothetical protein
MVDAASQDSFVSSGQIISVPHNFLQASVETMGSSLEIAAARMNKR